MVVEEAGPVVAVEPVEVGIPAAGVPAAGAPAVDLLAVVHRAGVTVQRQAPAPREEGRRPGGGGGGNTGMGSLNPYGTNSPWTNPSAQSRMIIPQLPDSTATNQNIMFMLAAGTGGFVIHETNDLIGGMEKIGKEQDEYYVLGYTPPDSEEGSCHTLRVKVDHGGHRSARPHRLLQFAAPGSAGRQLHREGSGDSRLLGAGWQCQRFHAASVLLHRSQRGARERGDGDRDRQREIR